MCTGKTLANTIVELGGCLPQLNSIALRIAATFSWAMIFYELIMDRKPFQSLSAEEHQNYVWEKGDRPLVASYSLPDGIKPLMEQAWANDPQYRFTIHQVVHQTKALLMNLEDCSFLGEDEFLFDVYIHTDGDAISEMGEAMEEVGDEPIAAEVVMDADVTFAVEDSMSESDLKSRASSSFSFVPAKQHKIVSSAA
jgi:hypothetical protein